MITTPNKPLITIIVAIAKNGVIGSNGSLPWYISEDLKRFKKLTLKKSVLMGRKTYDSIVERIGGGLPDRDNLILTKKNNHQNIPQNIHFFQDIQQVFYWLELRKKSDLVVAGGTSIYKKLMPMADIIEVTHINKNFEGDTVFPYWDKNLWQATTGEIKKDTKNGLEYYFSTYNKI